MKNITVLRDAAATAVYGAEGRDGVILIETKGSSCDGRKAIGRIENLSVLSSCRNKDFAGDPLILIDGKEATGKTIGCLDGGKVKNITVLRDAAATAVYGAKGRGGVISIETED